MRGPRITELALENFKSFRDAISIELKPLTVIIGRNNSGKSTLIQSLLLLKQTLIEPRREVMIALEGVFDALNLRELTSGFPSKAVAFETEVKGPTISLTWEHTVNVGAILSRQKKPDLKNLSKHSGVSWLLNPPDQKQLKTSIRIKTAEIQGQAIVSNIELIAHESNTRCTVIRASTDKQMEWQFQWNQKHAQKISVELDHFFPRISIGDTGPRTKEKAWVNAFRILFEAPMAALKKVLLGLQYLGASRQAPPSLFRPTTTYPQEVGVSGELAAQLLHRRQREKVQFLPPLTLNSDGTVSTATQIISRDLVDAVNEVMRGIGIYSPVEIKEIQEIGFRLLFGGASIGHVGRGLAHLLPVIELGLITDPIGNDLEDAAQANSDQTCTSSDMALDAYLKACREMPVMAIEEPEAHLHPKVASRLAHWFLSLARTNRCVIVETHSDHLVRRLRGLAARASGGSELEQWLLENVVILSVEQDQKGFSTVTSSRLTADGFLGETWPGDFMDESSDEESAIYYAKLDKEDAQTNSGSQVRTAKETDVQGTRHE